MARPVQSYLIDTHPELFDSLVDKASLSGIATHSNKKVEWQCQLGHRWFAAVCDRTRPDATGCPYCNNQKVWVGFNNLLAKHPEMERWLVNKEDGLKYTEQSSYKIFWKCEKGHTWEASISNVVGKGQRCPYCAGKRIIDGQTDLAAVFPEIASELVDQTLGSSLAVSSNKSVEWKCRKCGYIWKASVASRTRVHSGCPRCFGLVRTRGVNDLESLLPEVASMLADPSLGPTLSPGSERKVLWHCKQCDSTWEAKPALMVRNKGLCPYCRNIKHRKDLNDFATLYPELTKELVNPDEAVGASPHSSKKFNWKCSKGHIYAASMSNRTAKQPTGCPECAKLRSASVEQEDVLSVVRLLLPDTEIISADRTLIAPKELDIVIPALRLAIEFNGVIWHSERWHANCKTQHYDKMKAARDVGYQLIQIWSDDWRLRRDQIIVMLAHKFHAINRLSYVLKNYDPRLSDTVGARKLRFGICKGSEAMKFLDECHLQGRVSASYHFGLYDNDDVLRAVLSVRSARASSREYRKEGDWVIQRYATLGAVPGGFSKLLRHAELYLTKELGERVYKWISFSSNDVSMGDMYERCGFIKEKEIAPDYKYIEPKNGWRRSPKENYQKKRFRNDPSLLFDEVWTEHQAALANKLYRIYDAGKIRWVKIVDI